MVCLSWMMLSYHPVFSCATDNRRRIPSGGSNVIFSADVFSGIWAAIRMLPMNLHIWMLHQRIKDDLSACFCKANPSPYKSSYFHPHHTAAAFHRHTKTPAAFAVGIFYLSWICPLSLWTRSPRRFAKPGIGAPYARAMPLAARRSTAGVGTAHRAMPLAARRSAADVGSAHITSQRRKRRRWRRQCGPRRTRW